MSTGRGKIAAAALALALGLAGSAAAQPVAHSAAKKKVKVVFFKAHVGSDGFLTPGQPETVSVFDMPPKTNFRIAIEPPPTTLQCGQFYFCDFAPVSPAPGSPPFRTNKKGTAVVTFIMPSTYNISTDPFDPSTRHPVAWANGQRVHIDVQGVKRLKHKRKIGFGFGRAAVQTS
ncbi:MAG TPA: hypothetical protein VLB79_14965 [Solirubrobacterales bacterium]|nr:hypothetical protein [Solirubrobacterales bacterium]